MTDESIEDKYPHWKDALFGNHDAVANLRCGIEYVFWHAIYAAIAVTGAVIIVAVKLGKTIGTLLGPLSGPIDRGLDRVLSTIHYVANHEYTEKIFGAILFGLFIIMVVMMAGLLVYGLITAFWETLLSIAAGVGMVAAVVVAFIAIDYLTDPARDAATVVASGARRAGEKAVETPGVRRVYGECPVSLSQAPKWFDNLFPEDEL